MFYDESTSTTSMYSDSYNDFKSYTQKYNYGLFINKNNYNQERVIFYMKFYTLIEYMIDAIKNKTYDWILYISIFFFINL